MPLDPSIILRDISPKIEPYENVLAKQMQIKAAQQQYDENAFKMQSERDSMQQQNALAQFLSTNPNLNDPANQSKLYGFGMKPAQTYMKNQSDIDKTKSETNAKAIETQIKKIGMYKDALDSVQTPQDMAQWYAAQYRDPDTRAFMESRGSFDDMVKSIPQTPEEFRNYLPKVALGMTKYTEMNKPQFVTRNLGGTTDTIATDGMTGNTRVLNSSLNTQSPDNKASVGASYANAAATRAVAASNVEAARMRRDQDTEMKLGDDYRAQSKDFKSVGDAYKQINATLDSATKSPAATLAAATKFMKLLDPGSVVRESELGMALAATGVFDRATNYVNTLQSGKVLTPNQVKDFKAITEQIYNAAQTGQKAIDKDYTNKATAYKLRPEMIVQDLGQNAAPRTMGASNIDALVNKYTTK